MTEIFWRIFTWPILEAIAENPFKRKFRSLYGQWSFKKNCFWDLLNFIYNTLGIVVLSRQWKNAIYTPILIEYNLRSKGFKNLYNTNLDPILEGTDAESESSNDGDNLDPEDMEFDGIYFKF